MTDNALRGRTRYPGLVNSELLRFLPTDISDCVLWVAADRIIGLSDNDEVVNWTDLSDAANDLLQATAGTKPLYKTGVLSGKPVVRFDGTNDVLRSANNQNLKTIIAVAVYADAGNYPNYKGLVGYYVAGIVDLLMMHSGATILFTGSTMYNNLWVNGTKTNDTAPINSWHTIAGISTNTYAGYRISVGDDDAGNAARFWKGDIAEIISYNRIITDTERVALQNYLKGKYGHY
jgi:hypothetical protein